MREGGVTCQEIKLALGDGSVAELTLDQAEHLAVCDACMDFAVACSLAQKPEIPIPAGFAAHVATESMAVKGTGPAESSPPKALGLKTSIAALMMLGVVASIAAFVDPPAFSLAGWAGLAFELILTLEIAGVALWLGIGATGI
jgi:hypothetical protein